VRFDAIRPMLLDTRKHGPFSDPDWLFEPKYDGYRMLAEFGAGAVRMKTRQGLCGRDP
jgi:bifunctional non-homologous end joining protein LigD